jgi:hypothetical protein
MFIFEAIDADTTADAPCIMFRFEAIDADAARLAALTVSILLAKDADAGVKSSEPEMIAVEK